MGIRDLQSYEYSKFYDVGPSQSAVLTNDVSLASNILQITGETVSFSAGAAGTTGIVSLDKAPVFDAYGTKIGSLGLTSFAWVTGTVLTTEVAYNKSLTDTEMLASLDHNGKFAIDYVMGRIYYKKATTGTSDTCNYKTRQLNIEITGASDIEIGAVELKDGATDNRALVSAANTARAATDNVIEVQHLGANGSPLPSGTSTDPIFVKDTSTGTDVQNVTSSGLTAINATTAVANEFKLISVVCHFDTAPTTSENFLITLDSNAGSAYDTILYSLDPSLSSATDIVYIPDGDLKFKTADEILVTYTNTDGRTYGLTIAYQLI